MRRSLRFLSVIHTLILYFLTSFSGIWAQTSTFVIEEFMVHDGVQGVAELAGQTTYRFYLQLNHPDDFVSAIYGGDSAPMSLELDEPMFNTPFATGSTAGGILPAVAAYFPEVLYDSWITIGLESAPAGSQVDVSALQSEEQPFLQSFVSGSPTDGEGFVVNDELGGAWYLLTGASNGYAGDDLKVLVMQVTTAGTPSGILNAQIIPADPALEAVQVQQGYEGTEVWDLMPVVLVTGCTDPEACNYDSSATEDDGSCEYDSCGCTDVWACNYTPGATLDDGSCEYVSCIGCTDSTACNYDPNAIYNDGSCEYFSCVNAGCTSPGACNFDPEATVNDGSCDFTSCLGCTNPDADNYDPTATIDNGSCAFNGCLNPLACNYDPTANVADGSCEYLSCIGCMNVEACNYDPSNTISDASSCVFADEGYTCDGSCLNDSDGDGVCDEFEVAGCTNDAADNFNPDATDDDGSCVFAVFGCTNPLACNYDSDATDSDGSCEFTSCIGCMNPEACNFDEAFTIADNAACVFAQEFYDCNGDCIGDNDEDGVCNELEIVGCTDPSAINFDSSATDNDGSCSYPASCNDSAACNYTPYEGYCIEIEPVMIHDGMVGTTDLTGFITYRIYALCENPDDFVSAVAGDDVNPSFIHTTTSFFQHDAGGLLGESINPLIFPVIPDAEFDSWVTIGLDGAPIGGNGESGVSIVEGTEPWVEPFESGASLNISDDLGGAWFILNGATNGVAGDDLRVLLGQFTTDGNIDGQLYIQFFENGDGLNGGFNKMIGLHDACGLPSFDDCVYAEEYYDCSGNCLLDDDNDGICNELEVLGCMDPEANNFNASATDDDGSCDYYVDPCLDDIVPPYFTFVPADSTVQCDQAMPTAMAVAADDCDENVQVMFIDGPIEFVLDCPPYNYLCTRTFYATDDAGNQSQAIQMITVADTIAPVILNLPDELIEINEQEGEEIPDPFIVVQDACDGNAAWFSDDVLISLVGDTATYSRTYTTTDACGNSDAWIQTLIVILATEGCMDESACNYNPDATNEDGSCTYAPEFFDCEGSCLNDADGDGICDELEISGCTVANACNFDITATEEDGSCDYCSCADDDIPSFGLQIDTVAVHEEGALAGMVTYRMYVTTLNENDFISSIYGNDIDTLRLMSTEGWYQDDAGSHLSQNIDPSFYAVFPDLAYDSWVTIGLEGPPTVGENLVNTVGIGGAAGWINQFELGNDIILDDAVGGSWFILNGGANGIAGDDLKVLVAQVTTSGTISGQLNVQVFEEGDNAQSSLHQFTFEGTEWTNPPAFANACGCTDADASNYDPSAVYENGDCTYPVFGCIDPLACNYDEAATDDDGSCFYADPGYDCSGNCLEDSDDDGICDPFEIPGCTDTLALNYNDSATDDDGSCVYCSLTAEVLVSNVTCAAAEDGEITVSIEGAYPDTSEITYQLLPQDLIQTDSIFAGLPGGDYIVIATDESGCEIVVEVMVEEPEPLLILLDSLAGSEPGAGQGFIAVSVTGGTEPYSYDWIELGGAYASDEEDIDELNPGTYQLTVTDANDCEVTSFEIVVEAIVGIVELNSSTIQLYPNPATDRIQLNFEVLMRNASLNCYDMRGKLVWSEAIEMGNAVSIPVSGWSEGVYIIQGITDQGHFQKEFMVIR